MKKIILSVAIVSAAAAIVIGGSIAYFSDTETSVGNVFTAGTLDLRVDSDPDGSEFDWDAGVPVMNDIPGLQDAINKLKPGDSGIVIVGIQNYSDIPGLANIGIKNVVDKENTRLEQEEGFDDTSAADSGELSGAVNLVISYGDKSVIGDTGNWVEVWSGKLIDWKDYTGSNKDAPVAMAGVVVDVYDDDYWVLEFSIPTSVGNEIMSDSVTFDVEFGLEQIK